MAELAEFEAQRGRLWAIAYRIMGSVADADDAVQEAWLRWQALPGEEAVADPRGYLTTVVSRICYDLLGSGPCPPRGVRRAVAAGAAVLAGGGRRRPRGPGDAGRIRRAWPCYGAGTAQPGGTHRLHPA